MENQPLFDNRVATSGLITLDPEMFKPVGNLMTYDLKQNLFLEQVLKEKDFRDFLASHNWKKYEGNHIGLFCSVEAVIPLWAYMLLAGYLSPYAFSIHKANYSDLEQIIWVQNIKDLNPEPYKNKRVVVKGCGNNSISESVYIALTVILKPIVKSLMFGEPCSTVPLFKNGNTQISKES